MTNPLAENQYTLTKSLFSEGMGRVIRENYGKTAKYAVLALLAAWLLMAALTLILRENPAWLAVEAVVLALAALWISVYIPHAKTRAAWKKLEAVYGGELARRTLFFEDHLSVDAAGRTVTLHYESLERSLQTEHLWILIARDKTGILVKRDSFLHGSQEQIEALLPQRLRSN